MAQHDDILRQAAEHFKNLPQHAMEEAEVPPEEVEARRFRELNEKQVRIAGVFEVANGGAFVLLRDSSGRQLPIWIGQEQMHSIAIAIEGATTSRPMTHDLTRQLVEKLGGTVEYALVDDLHNNVYHAKLALRQGDRRQEVDCRPSDAIALAIRFKAPVYVADHVLEEGNWTETIEE